MDNNGLPLFGVYSPPNAVFSDGKTVTSGNIPKYLDTSGVLIGDSGNAHSNFLRVDGTNNMTAALNLASNDLNNSGNLFPNADATQDVGKGVKRYRDAYISRNLTDGTATRTIASLPTTSTGVSGNLASYSSASNIQDSGIASSSVSGGPFLPLAGGMMSGTLNMNTNPLTNVTSLGYSSNNVIAGTSATTGSSFTVVIGQSATIDNKSNDAVVVGESSSVTNGPFSVVVGPACTSAGATDVIIGKLNSSGTGGANNIIGNTSNVTSSTASNNMLGNSNNSTGSNAILIGNGNTASTTQGHCFGTALTNATAHSILMDASANFRSAATTCDLGTSSLPFQTLYLNTNITGPTYTRSADNIISCATTGTSGDIATFTGTAKVIQDSEVLLSSLLSSSTAASTYLPLAGGTMSGVLAMSSNNITGSGTVGCSGVLATAPSAFSAFASGATSISFTGGTTKLIALTFAQSVNAASDFTLTTASGLVTYNGTTTRWFKVHIDFSLVPVSSSLQLQLWVTQAGSPTPVDYINWNFYTNATVTFDYQPGSFERIVQLAQNNTIQFAGLMSGGSSAVLMKDVKVIITPIC